MEKVCWDIMCLAERLHTEGPSCLNIYDPALYSTIYSNKKNNGRKSTLIAKGRKFALIEEKQVRKVMLNDTVMQDISFLIKNPEHDDSMPDRTDTEIAVPNEQDRIDLE
ncbi:hypothetical protein ACEQ8H_003455 [Pleosporales sp. CAS-2024a]